MSRRPLAATLSDMILLLAPAALTAALWLAPPAAAQPPGDPPQCTEASHNRLRVQRGRDVCDAALSPSGVEQAVGLMPTRCLRPGATLQVDADGPRDLCVRKPS